MTPSLLLPLGILSGHDGPVRMCCFSRDGVLIASASGDQTIRIWETTSMKCLSIFDKHDCRSRTI